MMLLSIVEAIGAMWGSLLSWLAQRLKTSLVPVRHLFPIRASAATTKTILSLTTINWPL